jgi:hypothetical protein
MPAELPKAASLAEQVFSIKDNSTFQHVALEVFRFQYHNTAIYKSYCDLLKKTPDRIDDVDDIPFLPISFFKTHNVTTGAYSINHLVFESSGTTGQQASRHAVPDAALYQHSFRRAFEHFHGPVQDYCILGLLPSYLERQHSSLVYMVADLVQESRRPDSGFYLYDFEKLAETLDKLEKKRQKTMLVGVTFALLDFAEKHPMPLQHTLVMETGGMKGRRRELLREEVHGVLKKAFALNAIHSEYGMTELLSQAYAQKDGFFYTPPWMRVLIREEDDPLSTRQHLATGGLSIIDLANIHSCAFIATEDIGKKHSDGSFEVLGRLDTAEIRGCSLLVL